MNDIFNSKLKKLMSLREKAVDKCDLLEESKLSNAIGQLFSCNGFFKKSLDEHIRELNLSNSIGDQFGIAIAYRMVGECQCELDLFEDALKNQKIYHRIIKKLGNLKEEQCALATIGRTYFLFSHKFDEPRSCYYVGLAKEAYSSAWNCCETLLESGFDNSIIFDMKARLFVNFANLFENEKKYSTAKDFIYKCINISENVSTYTKFSAFLSLGSIYLHLYEYDKASEAFLNALNISRDECNIYLESQSLERLGFSSINLRNFQFAKDCWRKAIKFDSLSRAELITLQRGYRILKLILKLLVDLDEQIFSSKLDKTLKIIAIYESLGDLSSKIGAYNSGIYFYLKQLQNSLDADIPSNNLADIHVSLAITFNDMSKTSDAIYHYEQELKLKNFPTIKDKAKTMEILGDLFSTQVDQKEMAITYFNHAISLNIKESQLQTANLISNKIRDLDLQNCRCLI